LDFYVEFWVSENMKYVIFDGFGHSFVDGGDTFPLILLTCANKMWIYNGE